MSEVIGIRYDDNSVGVEIAHPVGSKVDYSQAASEIITIIQRVACAECSEKAHGECKVAASLSSSGQVFPLGSIDPVRLDGCRIPGKKIKTSRRITITN